MYAVQGQLRKNEISKEIQIECRRTRMSKSRLAWLSEIATSPTCSNAKLKQTWNNFSQSFENLSKNEKSEFG